jgi:hypothetical protein
MTVFVCAPKKRKGTEDEILINFSVQNLRCCETRKRIWDSSKSVTWRNVNGLGPDVEISLIFLVWQADIYLHKNARLKTSV